jgi:hypothetical protein
MRFYDVPVNQSVSTEPNRDLTSYRVLWPYTSAFKGFDDEFFSDTGAPGCPEQQEKVAFLERYKALGVVEVMRELVGIL